MVNMIGFIEYLISKGYKPYRKVMSKKGSTYVEDSNIGFLFFYVRAY